MDDIEKLKDENRKLENDITKNQNGIFISMGVIAMIVIASLGGGVIAGLILGKMLKTVVLSIGISVLLSVKSISDIGKFNRDIDDCNAQIKLNKKNIANLEKLMKQQEIKQSESKKNNYSYKPNKFAKKNEEFNRYLNSLKEDNFFDFNENDNNEDNHKSR